jgi:demethylmenaquinone methyltransferase / 2-methoxy-6-polyprenyl-1,4-benzoquinol methylase
MSSERNRFAARLFAGIAPQYDLVGALLSLGQDPRWRRFLVSRTNAMPGSWVLDVAAGTQLVSRELATGKRVRVVALDLSEPMLVAGREPTRLAGLDDQIHSVVGRAERLPFADATFASVTLTYLLRYVDDPADTVRELVRVLSPGASIAMLEFHVPNGTFVHAGWWGYTRFALPALGSIVSPAWARTARFLGPNVSAFVSDHPVRDWAGWFQRAGVQHIRTRSFLFGSAVVLWGVKGR